MGALSSDEARRVADALFQIDWISETDGYLVCRGKKKHTGADGPRDCRLMLDGGPLNLPPTIKCFHSSCAAEVADMNFLLRSALGKAESTKGWMPEKDWKPVEQVQRPPDPEYDQTKLEAFAGEWAKKVDLVWLANRSVFDPALITSAEFLGHLYRPGERVLVFTRNFSQGEHVWPDDALPTTGKDGVWFLCQPVDGEFRPNPRSAKNDSGPKMSRRSEESVLEYRYMVLESDEAPPRLWLGALAQLPLRIAAIYTSGGKSIHVLIRIEARLKKEWEESKTGLKAGLITLGADPGSLSGVRLTRLPGCWREGKTGRESYQRFETPRFQKLLYLNPDPAARPLIDLIPRRDVLQDRRREGDEIALQFTIVNSEELKKARYRFWYYAPLDEFCKNAAAELEEVAG